MLDISHGKSKNCQTFGCFLIKFFSSSDGELVLSKFEDGYYYRGVCLQNSDSDAKVHFLDYGNDFLAKHESILQLPPHMLYARRSHSVNIKLASGRPIEDIDADKTVDLLMDANIFEAEVEMLPGSVLNYLVTLDDSLVVFKK